MNSKVATFSALLASAYGIGQLNGTAPWTKLNNDNKQFTWVGSDIDGTVFARTTTSEICQLNF